MPESSMHMKRHKKNPHKKILAQKKPTYNYVFPQDELKARIDLVTVGMIKAVEDFPRFPFPTREEIEYDVEVHCEKMKITINAESLTNDYPFYIKIAKQFYTDAYLQNLTRYENDGNAYKLDKERLEVLGREKLTIELRDEIIKLLLAGRA